MNREAEAPSPDDHAGSAIDARGLRRVYPGGRAALDGVSLRVARGEWVALLGPNGSGKSTLLRMIATIDSPEKASGTLRVLGRTLPGEERGARAGIGVVFQKAGLDALLTVRENLRLQAALFSVTGPERIAEVAGRLGIADRLDDRVGRLSGGLARRVDLARAMLSAPELLLLDEPTTGLDLDARRSFLATLEQARSERPSMAIVMTTHLMDEAERGDRVVMLDRGRVVAEGTPAELRRGLGSRVVTTERRWSKTLEQAGLRVRAGEDGRGVVGMGENESVERAAVELLRAGAAFAVGEPTLGDVYLGATGRSLSEAAEGEPR